MIKIIALLMMFSVNALAAQVVIIYKDGRAEAYTDLTTGEVNKFRNYQGTNWINVNKTEFGSTVNESINPDDVRKIRVID